MNQLGRLSSKIAKGVFHPFLSLYHNENVDSVVIRMIIVAFSNIFPNCLDSQFSRTKNTPATKYATISSVYSVEHTIKEKITNL